MKPSECGTANPPADGRREREIVDRFADFLRDAPEDGDFGSASPARRYRLRFLAWRMMQVAK